MLGSGWLRGSRLAQDPHVAPPRWVSSDTDQPCRRSGLVPHCQPQGGCRVTAERSRGVWWLLGLLIDIPLLLHGESLLSSCQSPDSTMPAMDFSCCTAGLAACCRIFVVLGFFLPGFFEQAVKEQPEMQGQTQGWDLAGGAWLVERGTGARSCYMHTASHASSPPATSITTSRAPLTL